jgi:DNA-binding transcriptional regulator YdaS (Cro superfamily)
MRQSCATAREDSTTNAIAIESGTAGSVVIEGKRKKGSGYNLNFSIIVQIKFKFQFMIMACEGGIQKVNTVNACSS